MIIMKRQTTIILGLLVMAITMWAGPALATDGKLYPGLMCVNLYGDSNPLDAIRYHHNGGVSFTLDPNEDYRGGKISCPIIKDEHQEGQGIARVRVYYTNNSSNYPVGCSVYTRKHGTSGPPEIVPFTQGQVGPHTGFFEVSVPQTAHNGEFYYMNCFLPFKTGFGESVLHAYYVEER